ncbi:MAG: prolipoprotein diacylglyceryl transferase [Chloroflexi bacterium]|nr:prolipoprotein diacylglyceryl transferase [Chloroflexota bacterium]
MLSQYTQVLFWNIPTFRLAVAVAILASISLAVRQHHPRGRVVDAYLGALLVGILGARLFHVALNWDYFADNTSEIWQVEAGGLDWHGALLGGLIGIALVLWGQRLLRRWRPSPLKPLAFNTLLVSLIPALPLIGFGGWVGCWAAGCGYGKEVDSLANYPRWATSELVDVFGIVAPRYNTPYFGMALCVLGFLLVLILWRWRNPRVFWLLLVVLAACMFAIGFFRADHTLMFYGLRGDQILDVIVLFWGMIMTIRIPGQQGMTDE